MESIEQLAPNKKRYACEHCSKTYSTKKILRVHRKIHTGQMNYKCTLCAHSTYRKDYLTRHIRTHTNEKPYKCPHPSCPSAFSDPSALRVHQLMHKKEDESIWKFRCPVPNCQYKAIRKSEINSHSATHSTVKPFKCDLCPYRGTAKRLIKMHHRNVHSEEKRFKCPQQNCDYTSKQRGHLTMHIKFVHSNARPFACSLPGCTHTYKTKRDLERHEFTHGEKMPFKCSFCAYRCNDKSKLINHTRGHIEETPYSCHICPYQGKTTWRLTHHVKTCHKGKSLDVSKVKGAKTKKSAAQIQFLKCKVVTCQFSTGQNASLALHLNAAHNLPRVIL